MAFHSYPFLPLPLLFSPALSPSGLKFQLMVMGSAVSSSVGAGQSSAVSE